MARILVIDDDAQIRQVLERILEREGHHVVCAPNGKEAIRLQRQDPADLIITDLIMPEKEGIETIREIRHYFPDAKIIAISGGGQIGAEEYLQMAKKLGAQYTFTKPARREEMLRAVKDLLK
jgi:CheY-like chemotaxis protein